ncbi:hypothetical protein VTO73DRAFT_1751 [Trametes versicolor]
MDTLPLETLQRIFELACTDGGRTGHSLSLVSKGIRTAARTTRFHSIALIASPRRLQSFIDLYQRECDPTREGKPRIQHLHIAFPVGEPGRIAYVLNGPDLFWPLAHSRSLEPTPSPLARSNLHALAETHNVLVFESGVRRDGAAGTYSTRASQLTPKRNAVRPSMSMKSLLVAVRRYRTAAMELVTGRRRTSRSDHRTTSPNHLRSPVADHLGPTSYEEYCDTAQILFQLVAPDLVTLVVQYGFTSGPTYGHKPRLAIVDRSFPRLQEAAFVGVDDPRMLLSHVNGAADTPIFPMLTHLHVAPGYTAACGICLSFWTTHAPGVTHLGVSRAEDFLDDIAGAVGLRMPQEEPSGSYSLHITSSDDSLAYSIITPLPSSSPAPLEPPLTPMYPSVRHLVLQSSPLRTKAGCRYGGSERSSFARDRESERSERVARMCGSCEANGFEAFRAKAPVDGDFVHYYEQARRRWLERMTDGGDGAGGWRGDQVITVTKYDLWYVRRRRPQVSLTAMHGNHLFCLIYRHLLPHESWPTYDDH